MPVCDICNENLAWEDGYVLTTQEVTTTEAYWRATLAGAWAMTHRFDPEGDTLAMLVRQQANQSAGWLLCAFCSRMFQVDLRRAKTWAETQNANPPGSGPAPEGDVARAAALAWKGLYGAWPASVTPAASPTPVTTDRTSGSTDGAKRDSGCFIATTVYGDSECYEVRFLRGFRDDVLSKTSFGRVLMRTYYRMGPVMADRIERSPRAKRLARRVFDRMVSRIEAGSRGRPSDDSDSRPRRGTS